MLTKIVSTSDDYYVGEIYFYEGVGHYTIVKVEVQGDLTRLYLN